MAATLRDALRERLSFWPALQWLVAMGLLWHLLDPSPAQFATTLVSLGVFGLTEVVTDVYDVRQSVRNGGLGIYALVGGTAMLAFESGATWLPLAFLAVGAWFVLDAVQTARHEGATEDEPTGREVYRDYVARRAHETLTEGPRTRRELSAELDADDAAIDAAVERLRERGVIAESGSELRVESSADGAFTRMRERVVGAVGRIARPLTLELDGGERGAKSETRRGVAVDDRRTGPETAGDRGEPDADPHADATDRVSEVE